MVCQELGQYLHEFFGAEGGIALPKKDVDFTPDRFLGTPVTEGSKDLRPLHDDEWLTISPISKKMF